MLAIAVAANQNGRPPQWSCIDTPNLARARSAPMSVLCFVSSLPPEARGDELSSQVGQILV